MLLDGAPVVDAAGRALLRRRSQLVHQNPFASLDPRFTVGEDHRRAAAVAPRRAPGAQRRDRVVELLEQVALGAA